MVKKSIEISSRDCPGNSVSSEMVVLDDGAFIEKPVPLKPQFLTSVRNGRLVSDGIK